MKLNLSKGQVPEEILIKIRRHTAGTDGQRTRSLRCPYCNHRSIIVFEDSTGHVQAKCTKCGKESIYNVKLRTDTCYVMERCYP